MTKPIKTVVVLATVHDALELAQKRKDESLMDAAETVLSALVFRLRRKVVTLPEGAQKAYSLLDKSLARTTLVS